MPPMTPQVSEVLEKALPLSTQERGMIIGRLIDSLDDGPAEAGVEEAWADEIKSRVDDIRSGIWLTSSRMSSERFRFHPEARGDFREALGWYRDRSPAVVAEFRVIVSEVIRNIVKAPHRWPKYLHGTRRLLLHASLFQSSIWMIPTP